MRFLSTLTNDIRYQVKYGFYFLYTFISAIYIGILMLCPSDIRPKVASIIILTDPAMLGMFFIGGIWLLEKGEGVHGFFNISPLKHLEYIISKVVSLSIVSTLAATAIAMVGLGRNINVAGLMLYVFFGSMTFTALGLLLGSYARSVNQYILIASVPASILTVPGIMAAFGISNPLLNILPGTVLWYGIWQNLGISKNVGVLNFILLLLWLGLALCLTNMRIPVALRHEGGAKI